MVKRLSDVDCVKEVDPLDLSIDHVGDGIAPSTTHADDTDTRTKFIDFRPNEFDAHTSNFPNARTTCAPTRLSRTDSAKTLTQTDAKSRTIHIFLAERSISA